MSEETTEAKVAKTAKKTPAKKAAVKKAAPKKAVAKKSVFVKKAVAKPATPPVAKRGRPASKKTVSKRRSKKAAKQFGYMLLTQQEGSDTPTSGGLQGPFATERDALDDASIMSEENTTIVLFRETKRGKVQKQTKFVAGR